MVSVKLSTKFLVVESVWRRFSRTLFFCFLFFYFSALLVASQRKKLFFASLCLSLSTVFCIWCLCTCWG